MNKLIIIGNGFDLAHGYPTRYTDFILWLVKKELLTAAKSRQTSWKQKNPLLECIYNQEITLNIPLENYIDKNCTSILKSSKNRFSNFQGWNNCNPDSTEIFFLKAKSAFVEILFRHVCKNWVDIEQTYYTCLKSILKDDSSISEYDLRKLNEQLVYLCNQLREYLQSLKRETFIPGFQTIVNKHIDYENLFKPKDWNKQEYIDIEEIKAKSKTYILNFNYTNTVERYIEDKNNVEVNNIHGTVNDPLSPMIFGYGDELDDDFSLMEKQEVKGFLEHIKSLWYLRTRNYHNLIRFIESGYYQVQIIGHSCGRSDRTLLNMVFEHDNCNSVDIFYRKRADDSDSFNEISEEVSRQFKDKQKLRKRVLPKNPANVIPQHVDIAEMKTA